MKYYINKMNKTFSVVHDDNKDTSYKDAYFDEEKNDM